MSLLGWGGSPYPHCRCGHDRMAHIGYQPPRRGTTLELRRERTCAAVVGTGWCTCSAYKPETEPVASRSTLSAGVTKLEAEDA